ncbi:uncharacterized protein LOC132736552 isoform X4 [Ruditapes philippinarum]|uniref:uncharacterized protein LOC132736552 isoform X4 n=1 Tax=Ruditapes philippinarum TaxID=129788 RepID=UPI00295BAA6D|nr:uncharacterized protein LOC132736552 isoform X4 [Ruditapes philippinarum]
MADLNNELNRNLRHKCLKLPTGKKYYFYIVAAEDDCEQVEEIVTVLKERFHLKCLYDVVDCYPGVDKFNFMKAGMKESVKVVLFLSQCYTNDEWCSYQQKIALAASFDEKIPCIVPVILEDVGEETFSLLSFLTFVNARCVDAAGVASKIAESVESLDLNKSMFPLEFTNVIARFENGYSVEIPVEKDKLRLNRPAKRKFRVNRDLLKELTNSQMKVSEVLLHDVVQLVNGDPVMKTYDFLKKRNICCWGSVLSLLMLLLMSALIFFIVLVASSTRDRPDLDLPFVALLMMMLEGGVPNLYPIILVILVLAVPRYYHREKLDIDLQMKICSQFLRRCIDNDVIIVFSGRKNRQPSLQVVRYNFSKCQDYLEYFIQERRHHLLADINITPKEYALNMIEIHTAEISKVMTLNNDDLPDASQNRHTLRKGKECLCQRIERCLSLVERTNII